MMAVVFENWKDSDMNYFVKGKDLLLAIDFKLENLNY